MTDSGTNQTKRGFAVTFLPVLVCACLVISQAAPSVECLAFRASGRSDDAATSSSTDSTDRTIAVPAPGPEAVRLADHIIAEADTIPVADSKGGLWVSGDVEDALSRLHWIVGRENEHLISVSPERRVILSARELVSAAGAEEQPSEARLQLASYISSNEGLLLLIQIDQSVHRYLLHIGRRAPTAGGEVFVQSPLNMDHNFDSRINPYRRNGEKLLNEQPPKGFDSLIAINPGVRWLNLRTKLLVPPGNITFDELAEAYGKLEFGLDYLARNNLPGAHELAIQREEKLLSQRPTSDCVATTGMNRMLPLHEF